MNAHGMHPLFDNILSQMTDRRLLIRARVHAAIEAGVDPIVELDDDRWRVIGIGRPTEGGYLCHLASTTRGFPQANGWRPLQIMDVVEFEALERALEEVES